MVVIASMLLLVACSSPASESINHISESTFDERRENEQISIYDLYDIHVATIENYGELILTDEGLFYGKITDNEKSSYMEYYLLNLSTLESDYIGKIDDWSYTAGYDTVIYNNHIYMLVTTGDIWNNKADNYLYDVDCSQKKMSYVKLDSSMSPYSSMTILNDYVYISMVGHNRNAMYRYDIKNQKLDYVKKYSFDANTNEGDVIRHITADQGKIYLLRLYMKTESYVKLFIDVCDENLSVLRTVDVTDLCSSTTVVEEDIKPELRQLVSYLTVKNGYVYYENFSISRFLFKFSDSKLTDTAEKVMDCSDGLFSAYYPFDGNDIFLFEFNENCIYRIDTLNKEMKTIEIPFKDKRYGISDLYLNGKGDMLAFAYYHDPDTGETLPEKIYYVPVE